MPGRRKPSRGIAKTLYVRAQDIPVWEKATQLLKSRYNMSTSTFVAGKIAEFVADELIRHPEPITHHRKKQTQ
jgi:hypothetical protein